VNTHEPLLVILATLIGLVVIWPPITAILGTMFSESFSKEVRYTGVTLGYQIGAAVAGGSAPMIAEFLMNQFDGSSIPVSLYIVATALISILAVLSIKGERDRKSTRLNSSHVSISYAFFCFGCPTAILSFPTRRSSDLKKYVILESHSVIKLELPLLGVLHQ